MAGRSSPDSDAGDRPQEPDVPIGGRDIFCFPRGAHAGKCLHAIFEHVDFANAKRDSLDNTVDRATSTCTVSTRSGCARFRT